MATEKKNTPPKTPKRSNNAPAAFDLNYSRVPMGTILPFAAPLTTEVVDDLTRNGWLLCDGKSYRINDYHDLWHLLRDTYGPDSAGVFYVPDLQARVPIGAGQGTRFANYPLGRKDGSETHLLTIAQMPPHQHTAPNHNHTWLYGGGGADICTGGQYHTAVRGGDGNIRGLEDPRAHPGDHGGYITSDGGGSSTTGLIAEGSASPFSIVQPFLAIHFIIKAK